VDALSAPAAEDGGMAAVFEVGLLESVVDGSGRTLCDETGLAEAGRC